MEESFFPNGTTPLHRVPTPEQPNTAARMLSTDNHSRVTSPVPPLQKPVNTVMPLPPPLTYVSTSPSHQSTGAAEQHTPKRTESATTPAAATTAARRRSAAVPSLHTESLNLSSINSSSPSPLSEWSNRTEKHRGPTTAAAASESPVRRGSTDTTDSAADPSQQPSELVTVLPSAASPSSKAGCGDTSPIAERSSAYATQCTNDTLQPAHDSANQPTSHSSVCRSARVSLNLDSAFLATQAGEQVGNDSSDAGAPPLPCTPSYVPETLEERRNRPDLSPCTVSSTSAGGSLSPAFHRRSRGTVWLCDVSREDEDEENSEGSTPVRTQRQQQRQRRCSAVGSTSATRQDTDRDSSSDHRSKPLRPASSSGSVHRSLFPHATEAYVSAHPSGAPVSSASRSTSLSPVHARVSLTDHDFSAQYALFQPPTYSLQQCTLHEAPAQASPSHTELLTDVFADGVAAAATPAAALPGFGASTRVTAPEDEEGDGAGFLSVQTSPDTQPLPSASPHLSRTVDGALLFHSASSARLHNTYGQLPHGSPFSGEADMATQVFRSGTHVLSPLQQRHSIPSDHLHLIRESSPMNYRLHHAHLCSPPVSPQRGKNAASLCHHLHHNLLDDTLSSLHSRADTSGGHSSLHTPRNVSAVAGGSESASVASSPLLTSFAASCGGPSLSLASAAVAAAQTSMADLVRRADTPTSPHTPLDRRTPGPSGMQGSSYASLSEYSHAFSQHHTHRPQLSQPMTPQKSARRTYSRQTTPSQSFRSKVQSHSFESQQLSQLAMQQQQQQQQPHAQFFSGLWTARGQVNTSASSCVLGETTMTTTVAAAAGAAAAERDYLAPSRNPFSPYRSLKIYADPLAQPNAYSADRLKASSDEESGAAAPAVLHRAGQQPLTQQQSFFVRELTTAVLRPDAAVVLYEQIIPAPARAPGSHRARQRAPSPAQAALDLLLQPRPSLSHSLSLSGGGASGRGWGGTGAAGASAQVNRDEGLLTQEAKFSLTTPPPAHTHSLVHTTAPHTEGQQHAVSSPSSTTASPAQRPQVALAKCSPRHAPAGSPPRTPGRTTRPPDTAGGTRTAPALVEPRPDAVALPASTFTTPLSNEAKGEKDGIGSSASFSSVAARNLSSAFSSPEEVAQHPSRPLFGSGKSSLSKMVVDNSTNNNNNHMEEEEDEEDASPPPRRPTTQFDARNPDTSLSPDGTPLYAERQLHFNPNAEEEEENAETSVQALASSCVIRASLGGVDHESSMATESSSTGSPDFLRSTVANVNPLSEQLSSSVRLHQSLHSALRSGAEEDARSAAAAAQQPQPAPLPSSSTGAGERMQEGWRSPEPPRPQLGQQQQQQRQEQSQQQHFTPTQEPPGLRLSVESNRAPTVVATNTAAVAVAGHLFSGERICLSSNEAGSTTLSPSAYQALGSVLDALDTTVTSDEEIAGDRFQAHHEFQFLHYVDTALDAAVGGTFDATVSSSSVTPPSVSRDGGRPVPLSVEVNGVTWLATHRLSGLPYAVKEVPAVAFNTAELQCLTLSNSRSHSSFRSNALSASSEQRLSLQDLLEAEDYLARYHGVSTPPQDSSKPTVHLLQLEYFPRGSLYDVVRQHNTDSSSAAVAMSSSLPDAATQLSVPALLTCDFWEAVVQQGLRGLRVLHRAGLLHGSPLPFSLFFAGHTEAQRWVKWAGFGSARSGADIYPTESLPPWLGEAVGLLYKQREAAAAVPAAAVIDVAVFCLSVLELIVDHVEVRDRAQGLLPAARPPTHPAAADALCRLEWMEVMVRRLDGRHKRHGAENGDDAEEVELQRFMQFLWNTANSYHTAEQVLAEMCIRIDPALHTVTALYQYEIDRLARQLRERERRAVEERRRHEASCSSSLQSSHHERNGSVLSTTSAEATRFLSPHEEGSARASHWGGSSRCPRPWTSGVAAGRGLANPISGPALFSSTFFDEQRAVGAQRLSPHFFPRRAPTSAARVPRATFLDVSAEHDVPSSATAGEGICLFLPTTTAAAAAASTKLPSPATVPALSLTAHRPASEGSAWCPTTARRGRADVHPRVREAAHAMLLDALSPLADGDSMTLQHVWKALLRPAVHSLQLRGWMSMYAGIPLSVTGVGRKDGDEGEEAALEALLTSLRPMTSFE